MDFAAPHCSISNSSVVRQEWEELKHSFTESRATCATNRMWLEQTEGRLELSSLLLCAASRQLTDIEEVIARLGISMTKLNSLLTAVEDICLPSFMLILERFRLNKLQRTSLETLAVFCDRLVRQMDLCGESEKDQTFTRLMTHNIFEKFDCSFCKDLMKKDEITVDEKYEVVRECRNCRFIMSSQVKSQTTEETQISENGSMSCPAFSSHPSVRVRDVAICESSNYEADCDRQVHGSAECGKFCKNVPEKGHWDRHHKTNTCTAIEAMLNFSRAEDSEAVRTYKSIVDIAGVEANGVKDETDICEVKLASTERLEQICIYCEKCLQTPSLLKRHLIKHSTNKPFSCTICGHGLKRKAELKAHMRKHCDQRDFKCGECSKVFKRNDHLKVHQRIHTGEKPYTCWICSKTFSHLTSLQVHKASHSGGLTSSTLKFICETCGKSFRQRTAFANHLRVHTQEKPFSCEECNKCFSSTVLLKQHKRIHKQELSFVCDVCGKKFRHNQNLHTHKRTHTGKRPYICDICAASYVYGKNLKRHRKNVHGIDSSRDKVISVTEFTSQNRKVN